MKREIRWAEIARFFQRVMEERCAQNFKRRVDDRWFISEFNRRRNAIERGVKEQFNVAHLSELPDDDVLVNEGVCELYDALRSYVRGIYDILDDVDKRSTAA